MGVAGLIYGPDTGHLSEYGGRDDEDVAPREHDAAILKKNLRENFEEEKFETGKLRNHYPPPLCRLGVLNRGMPLHIPPKPVKPL